MVSTETEMVKQVANATAETLAYWAECARAITRGRERENGVLFLGAPGQMADAVIVTNGVSVIAWAETPGPAAYDVRRPFYHYGHARFEPSPLAQSADQLLKTLRRLDYEADYNWVKFPLAALLNPLQQFAGEDGLRLRSTRAVLEVELPERLTRQGRLICQLRRTGSGWEGCVGPYGWPVIWGLSEIDESWAVEGRWYVAEARTPEEDGTWTQIRVLREFRPGMRVGLWDREEPAAVPLRGVDHQEDRRQKLFHLDTMEFSELAGELDPIQMDAELIAELAQVSVNLGHQEWTWCQNGPRDPVYVDANTPGRPRLFAVVMPLAPGTQG